MPSTLQLFWKLRRAWSHCSVSGRTEVESYEHIALSLGIDDIIGKRLMCATTDVLGSVAFTPVKNDMLGNIKVCKPPPTSYIGSSFRATLRCCIICDGVSFSKLHDQYGRC